MPVPDPSSSDLIDAWDQIDLAASEVDAYERLRLKQVTACRAYAARRLPEGLEAIVLEIDKAAIPPGTTYPDMLGLSLQAYPLSPGRTGDVRLVLEVSHAKFRDIFRSLGVDLVRALEKAGSQKEAVEALVGRLVRWQAFLREHAADRLSAERVRGLFGELAVLRTHLIARSARIAIDSWRGPTGGSHDFQFTGGSLEAKTTISASPARFRVSNIQQLDESNVSKLFLCLVLLQESESEGESLPEMADAIRGSLVGAEKQTFDDALIAAGYLDTHRQQYSSPRFVASEFRTFEVRDGFPRLVRDAIPQGVANVRYEVEIGACVPFQTNTASTMDLLMNDQA